MGAETVDWTANYSCRYRMFKVDADTWQNTSEVATVYTASIEHNGTDDVPMLESATATVDTAIGERFEPGYYRINALVEQNGYDCVDLGTFWMLGTSTSMAYDGLAAHSVTGYSVLRPADRAQIITGTYCPKKANGATWVRDFLAPVLKAPISVEGDGFTIDEPVVFSAGDTYLNCAWSVLDAGNWIMKIDPLGRITICAKPTEPSLLINVANSGLIEPSVDRSFDISDVPNSYTVVNDNEKYTITNDDPDSDTSTVTLGMTNSEVETSPTLSNGETLYNYARRMMNEKSTVPLKYSYTREYTENVLPFDIVRCSFSQRDMVGDYTVMTQSLTLGKGITVKETIGTNVQEYKA